MWWIRHTEVGYYANVRGGVLCLMWWKRHTEVGMMLTWWGIMLDVVDTPYRGGVL